MIDTTCEVWLDGVWFPSTPTDAVDRAPVVLAPLRLDWGRDDPTQQPDTATCSFTVRVWDPPDDLLAVAHVGTTVDVWAADPTPPTGPANLCTFNPSFEGPYAGGGAGGATVVRDTSWSLSGDASIRVTPVSSSSSAAYPTGAGDANGQSLARLGMVKGGTYTMSATIRIGHVQTGTLHSVARCIALISRAPGGALAGFANSAPAPNVPGVYRLAVTFTVPTTGIEDFTVRLMNGSTKPAEPVWWDGLQVDAGTTAGVWVEQPRRVLVHSGTVSDLSWSAVDADAVDLDLISVDVSAPLGNRPVGDTPWPVNSAGTRAQRVVTLTGLPVTLRVDSGVSGVLLSARDVDAQPALELLRDIAQSAGGVLWPSTDAALGGYLWLEDPATRASLKVLTPDPDSGLIVVDNPRDPGGDIAILSACDLIRDPVRWVQSAADVVTTVDVSWLEQTLGDDGLPEPTEQHVIVTDPTAEAMYGVNRESLSTELVSAADATTRANAILAESSSLVWRVDGITYDTALVLDTLDTVDNPTRLSTVLDLLDGTRRNGLAVTLIDLPAYAPIAGDTVSTYVEGGRYTYADDAWLLEVNLSPTAAGGASAPWSDLPSTLPAWSWGNVDPSVTWQATTGAGVYP